VGPRGREAQEILPEGFAEWPSVCLSAVGYPPQVKNMWSKETVTTPLAFNAAWVLSCTPTLVPSVPVRWALNVLCSTSLRWLFSSPNLHPRLLAATPRAAYPHQISTALAGGDAAAAIAPELHHEWCWTGRSRVRSSGAEPLHSGSLPCRSSRGQGTCLTRRVPRPRLSRGLGCGGGTGTCVPCTGFPQTRRTVEHRETAMRTAAWVATPRRTASTGPAGCFTGGCPSIVLRPSPRVIQRQRHLGDALGVLGGVKGNRLASGLRHRRLQHVECFGVTGQAWVAEGRRRKR
jgi:hypothetical protein